MTVSTCPDGHASSTDDYCDVCGSPMGRRGGRPRRNSGCLGSGQFSGQFGLGSRRVPSEVCAIAARPGTAVLRAVRPRQRPAHPAGGPPRHAGGAPPGDTGPARTGWSAVVRADRDWFEEVRRREGPDVAELAFPPFCPERRFALAESG